MNDGTLNKGDAPQLPSPHAPPPVMTQVTTKTAMPQNWTHIIEVPLQIHLPPRTSDILFVNAGSDFGFGGLDIVATCQIAREDLSTAKAKASSLKHAQKRRTTTSTPAPSILPLNTPPSNGLKNVSLLRKRPQGPSPVDNDLELDANFLLDMVVKNARRHCQKGAKDGHQTNHRRQTNDQSLK